MIKIISGWSNPGGSTTAFVNLTNLFNENNIDCCFYGPHNFHLDKCKSGNIQDVNLDYQDVLIIHFKKLPDRIPVRKLVFQCHEQHIFPMNEINYQIYDTIIYVSEHQKQWHRINHPSQIVIPNVVEDLKPTRLTKNEFKIGGVIGSIDRNKNTHVSIQKALEDGCETVYLFGNVTDIEYFREKVEPILEQNKRVKRPIYMQDKQIMYNSISDVYHYSLNESWGYVKAECEKTGTKFHSNGCCKEDVEFWNNTNILNKWKEVLEL